MVRSIIIVVIGLTLLTSVYTGVYRLVTSDVEAAMTADRPELEWLRREYQISDEQFAEIRRRHEAHDVICKQLCLGLVEAQENLDQAIAASPEMGPEVAQALEAWSHQREVCRQAAIEHMYSISSVMDAAQAVRYRERIYKQLIVTGRMPHIDEHGEFHDELIEHAAPAEVSRSADD